MSLFVQRKRRTMERTVSLTTQHPKKQIQPPLHALSTLFQHFKLPKKSFTYFPEGLVDLKKLAKLAGGVVFDLDKPNDKVNFVNLLKVLGITVVVYQKQFDKIVENTMDSSFSFQLCTIIIQIISD